MPEDVKPSIHLARLESRKTRTARRMADYARRHNITDMDELSAVQLPWFEVRNDTQPGYAGPDREDAEATVFIYEEIGGSFGIQASELCREIDALDVSQINVRINSPGGNVFDALAIHSSLLHHRAHVTTYVDGIAASAASVIAMAGDEVIMMPGSELMIHDASSVLDGNPREFEGMAAFLHRQSDNIAGLYAARAGGDVDEWRALMQAETWLFAREAVTVGLATSVHPYTAHPVGTGDSEMEERMLRTHNLGEWRYRYAGRRASPAPDHTRARRAPVVATERARAAETPVQVFEMPSSSDRMAAANLRASRFGELRQMQGRQLRLQEHAPSGTSRPGVEFPTSRLEASMVKRDGKDFVHVEGYATVYDRPYEMWDVYGPYEEVVVSGSADQTLASNPDTAFLVNHRGLTMARTTNGSLVLATDTQGMPIEAWMNPTRSDVQLLRTAIDDNDVDQMSFAFIITRGEWSDDFLTFYIRAFDIHRGDVSAVNYGANPYTSISARAREIMNELEHLPGPAAREAVRRLSLRLNDNKLSSVATGRSTKDLLGDEVVAEVMDTARQTEPTGRSIAHVQAMLTMLESDI